MTFRQRRAGGLEYETAPALDGVVHGFTTRLGGVSRGVWASLNLATTRGDDPEAVDRNYDLLCAALALPRARMVFTRQVHGVTVRPVTSADAHTLFTPIPYEADGIVTDEPGVPLICFAADCVPILLYDPVKRACGAVHAGWRGTAGDILGHAVRVLSREYGVAPETLRAAVGPHIGPCCFETGPEVPAALRETLGADAEPFLSPRGEKTMVDLGGANRALLLRAGLRPEHIDVSDSCTMCLPQRFWSHRFTGGARGVQAALVML